MCGRPVVELGDDLSDDRVVAVSGVGLDQSQSRVGDERVMTVAVALSVSEDDCIFRRPLHVSWKHRHQVIPDLAETGAPTRAKGSPGESTCPRVGC